MADKISTKQANTKQFIK